MGVSPLMALSVPHAFLAQPTSHVFAGLPALHASVYFASGSRTRCPKAFELDRGTCFARISNRYQFQCHHKKNKPISSHFSTRRPSRSTLQLQRRSGLSSFCRNKKISGLIGPSARLDPYTPTCDSGVPWIGSMPTHWRVVPNRYIFREQNTRSLNGEETHFSMSQRYGLVPAKDLNVQTLQSESYDGAKLCRKGDLVQNRLKAHLAVFGVSPCDGLVSPDYSVFRLVDQDHQPVFFERLFKTPNVPG